MAGRKERQKQRQVAALPLRLGPYGVPETLLVTSRRTRRWVLPKGNLMKGLSDSKAAATEAVEEAGVLGTIRSKPYGSYDYWKRRAFSFELCQVDVFLMFADGSADDWKERGERQHSWVPLKAAARMVLEPALQSIFRRLAEDGSVEADLGKASSGRRAAPREAPGRSFQAA